MEEVGKFFSKENVGNVSYVLNVDAVMVSGAKTHDLFHKMRELYHTTTCGTSNPFS
jgi:hypothetical protein